MAQARCCRGSTTAATRRWCAVRAARRSISRSPVRSSSAAIALLLLGWTSLAEAQPTVVWPVAPNVDPEPAERALQGIEVVSFDALRTRLNAHAEAARVADAISLAAVQTALESARAAYLEQRWDDAIATLDRAELDALEVLARPPQSRLAWELQLLRGMVHLARNQPDEARTRFVLALALDGERRPARDLYGPEVVSAFAEAVAARASLAPRPVALTIEPADARVTVDGRPRIDATRALTLTPGLHLVRVAAPGFEPRARLLDVAGEIVVKLAPAADADVELARLWADEGLSGDGPTEVAALLATARSIGAERILLVRAGPDRPAARVITSEQNDGWVMGGSLHAAARLAVEPPRALDPPLLPPPSTSRPVWKRWWFWTAAAGVAVSAAALGYAATVDRSDRYILRAD